MDKFKGVKPKSIEILDGAITVAIDLNVYPQFKDVDYRDEAMEEIHARYVAIVTSNTAILGGLLLITLWGNINPNHPFTNDRNVW